jgi:hypothetical protein
MSNFRLLEVPRFLLSPKAVNCLGYHRKSEYKSIKCAKIYALIKFFLAIQQYIDTGILYENGADLSTVYKLL